MKPAKYRPIAKLPDVTGQYVVFYNFCNGPHIERLTLPEDAADHREDGCWTHFILLEDMLARPAKKGR